MYVTFAGDLYTALRLYAALVNVTLTSMSNVPSDQREAIAGNGTLILSMIHSVFDVSVVHTNVEGKNLNSI